MLSVSCSGTPYEVSLGHGTNTDCKIGHQHGSQARDQVHGTMAFYKAYFVQTAKMEWESVCAEASKWLPFLEREYPHYVQEMQGE